MSLSTLNCWCARWRVWRVQSLFSFLWKWTEELWDALRLMNIYGVCVFSLASDFNRCQKNLWHVNSHSSYITLNLADRHFINKLISNQAKQFGEKRWELVKTQTFIHVFLQETMWFFPPFFLMVMQIIHCVIAFNHLMCVYLQKVLEDQGNLSRHAVQADRQYRADQPNPEGPRGLRDPERFKRYDNISHCIKPLS